MTAGPNRAAMRTVDALGVGVELTDAAETVWRLLPPADRVDVALADESGHVQDPVRTLTRIAVARTRHLALHAGVVATHGGAVAFPGISGAGKTTLVAACVQRGMDYLSDEVLALDRESCLAVPFPRVLPLGPVSRTLLGLSTTASEAEETFVGPEEFGRVATRSVPVHHVVVLDRRPGSTQIDRLTGSEVLASLIPRCFNHFRDPRGSLETLTRVARSATGWAIRYENALDAAAMLGRALHRSDDLRQ